MCVIKEGQVEANRSTSHEPGAPTHPTAPFCLSFLILICVPWFTAADTSRQMSDACVWSRLATYVRSQTVTDLHCKQ